MLFFIPPLDYQGSIPPLDYAPVAYLYHHTQVQGQTDVPFSGIMSQFYSNGR
jgi:hypothetical protein